MKFREFMLPSGARALLGKNAENNDGLMKKFKGKENIILHTAKPGSPFCVIGIKDPSKEDIKLGGVVCARYSQDWRDNKKDISVNVFTGKDVSKKFWMKKGTWKVKKFKTIKIKKVDILNFERSIEKNGHAKPSSARKKRNN